MDPEIVVELSRAVAWLALGFAAAVVSFPFVFGWRDGDGD